MTLMFVCTGNSCRSIIAEGLMKKMLSEKGKNDIKVISSGTGAIYGLRPTSETIEVMQEQDCNVSEYFSKPVTNELIDKSDLIFVMTEVHKNRIIEISPESKNKVKLLKENGISDPIGSGLDTYRECLSEIKECLDGILKEMK